MALSPNHSSLALGLLAGWRQDEQRRCEGAKQPRPNIFPFASSRGCATAVSGVISVDRGTGAAYTIPAVRRHEAECLVADRDSDHRGFSPSDGIKIPQPRIWSTIIQLLLLAMTVVFQSGCDFVTGKVSLSDPRLTPMLHAIAAVDRAALGFTPIPTNAVVHLHSRPRAGHDAMLHMYTPAAHGRFERIIEFRKTAAGYQWILEQEVHPGPRTFIQSGHTAHEFITITYDAVGIGMSGVAPGKLHVGYTGQDSRIANRKDLTIEEVRPVLAEWSQKP